MGMILDEHLLYDVPECRVSNYTYGVWNIADWILLKKNYIYLVSGFIPITGKVC